MTSYNPDRAAIYARAKEVGLGTSLTRSELDKVWQRMNEEEHNRIQDVANVAVLGFETRLNNLYERVAAAEEASAAAQQRLAADAEAEGVTGTKPAA